MESHSTMLLKLKFVCNAAMLDIENNGLDTIIFKPKKMLGILDLKSLSYYKIKEGILQQNLSKYYKFERADTLCEHFNKFINNLKKRKRSRGIKRKLSMFNPSDERKYMTDKEILDKYIGLDKSCLMKK